MILHRIHELGKSCGGPGMCAGEESCLDYSCQNHPEQPWNIWGAGRPLEQRNGGEQITEGQSGGFDAEPSYWPWLCAAAITLLAVIAGVISSA